MDHNLMIRIELLEGAAEAVRQAMLNIKYAKQADTGSERTKARVSRSKRKYHEAMQYLKLACDGIKDDFEESDNQWMQRSDL